ncbi:hypothetical protein ACGC1H_007294 [Rhizoctonia solani]
MRTQKRVPLPDQAPHSLKHSDIRLIPVEPILSSQSCLDTNDRNAHYPALQVHCEALAQAKRDLQRQAQRLGMLRISALRSVCSDLVRIRSRSAIFEAWVRVRRVKNGRCGCVELEFRRYE